MSDRSMAYRRRQGVTRASTFKEEIHHPPNNDDEYSNINIHNYNNKTLKGSYSFSQQSSLSTSSPTPSPTSSLAAQAIRASASHRDSSLSSAYADSSFGHPRSKGFTAYEDESSRNDSKGFWGILARKAKAILEEDNVSPRFESYGRTRSQMFNTSPGGQSSEGFRKMDNPTFRKGLDRITSSLNQIGDTFEKAFEEGRTIVENKTADIIQETRKLQIRRKGNSPESPNQAPDMNTSWPQPLMQPIQIQTNHDTQLKASRDVAMATAAKAKLLLRELKTVKADLAFAKERCSQLEEENKILRESREKGGNLADDDLIRLQLETLLAEKARLAHENSVYARENRFLREIVEYHQLTMQDVVYLDECNEEVTEVYPVSIPGVYRMLSVSPPSPTSPPSPSTSLSPPVAKEIFSVPIMSETDIPPNSCSSAQKEDHDAAQKENHEARLSVSSV